ncbi:MAG: type II toxin-antitoxin system VapC family toxin [Pseudomonadota bacterium]
MTTIPVDLVIASSAVIAILEGESERARFIARIQASREAVIAAPNYVECGIVLDRRRAGDPRAALANFCDAASIDIRPVDADMAARAVDAHFAFGRGRHPAALNFGDCFAYALAKAADAPLLFKGGDFTRTDIRAAL